MAKILYSTIGFGVKELYCYHDQFTNALKKHGNEILVMTSNKIIKNGWSSNDHFSYVDEKKLDEFIKSFNPDLVIASNNVLYNRVPKIIDCPIVIFAADKPIGYADNDKIKKNVDRYHFIYETIDWEKQIYELFNPKSSRMIMMPTATDIEAESLEQDLNISFIGSNFNYTHNFKNYFTSKNTEENFDKFKQFYNIYKSDLSKSVDDVLKKLNFDKSILGKISEMDLLNTMSGNKRSQALAAISDLGLSLYGTNNWIDVLDYSFELALCYEKKKIITAKQNQDIYNRSKIAINLSHEQALDNFSWRVRDIMASNACLVSDYRKNLEIYFGKYVKIPTFNNPFEAQDLCRKLLKAESWRSDVVKGCQLAIEEEHRFCYRLRDMEQALGVKLVNDDVKGSISFLNPNNFMEKPNFVKNLLSENGPFRVVNRVRVNIARAVKKKNKFRIKRAKNGKI